jgi:two-component system, OmpR family, phosphate regulon sensor histidine kinase PhoR
LNFTTRLFLGAVAILLVSTAVLLFAADRWLRRDLERALAQEVERDARVVAAAIPQNLRELNPLAHRFGAILGRRVTLIDREGTVLGDSDFDDASLRLLENHRGRPEIEAALAGTAGIETRLSTSTNRAELKIAVPGGPGVVRVSAPLSQVDTVVHTAQQSVLVAALIGLLCGTIWAGIGGRRIGRPLAEIGRAAQALSAGDQPVFPVSAIPEIRQMVHSLRSMDDQLRARMTQLRREREETGALIESMIEGVIASDDKGEILICNNAARRILSYGPEQRIPNIRALFHDRGAREVVEEGLTGHAVDERETEMNGRVLLFAARPLPHGGVMLVIHDVTAMKRLEIMRRDFVANASHELKTPLTSISGYADTLLADEIDQATRRRFLEVISENAHRMQRLVDDLLDLARLESGRWALHPEEVDIHDIAGEAWAPLAHRATQRGVRLSITAHDHKLIYADPDALRHVLMNLFDNSIRHTPGGGDVTVTAVTSRDGVEILVRDTGSGIPAESLPRVFERFYRADPGRSRDEGGTGLGLAIVKHLVEAHGGSTQVESTLGKGTTFRIHLPLARGRS